jgi:hypothetical protein
VREYRPVPVILWASMNLRIHSNIDESNFSKHQWDLSTNEHINSIHTSIGTD